MAKKQPLKIGTIAAAHGVRGEVKIRSFTKNPSDLFAYGPLTDASGRTWRFKKTGEIKEQMIAKPEGIDDRNAAESLKGLELFADPDQLPPLKENEVYASLLTGKAVCDVLGKIIGHVKAMHYFGAGDIVEIAFSNGTEEMFPFHKDIFPDVDAESEPLTFIPPAILGK